MDPEIFYILGKIALALGDKTTALANFRSSISKDPNEPSYIEQARICMADSEYVQAGDLLKEALKYLLGYVEYRMKIQRCWSYWGSAAARWVVMTTLMNTSSSRWSWMHRNTTV
jgi:tetratricopeptide (TPR) repeat protein